MPDGREPPGEQPAGGQQGSDLRDYLAEERTFLAWIRTILGVMGLGALLARIDRPSLALGTALVVIGAALSLLAVRRHRRMVRELNRPQFAERAPSRQGAFLALTLAVAGVIMALYLILS